MIFRSMYRLILYLSKIPDERGEYIYMSNFFFKQRRNCTRVTVGAIFDKGSQKISESKVIILFLIVNERNQTSVNANLELFSMF